MKMDCCTAKSTDNANEDNQDNKMKGGAGKMEISQKTWMWIAIIVLFLAVVFLTYKVASTGKVASSTGVIDTSGWTDNEKMNYEMHGTIPARFGGGSSSGSGMVGGC